MLSSLILFKIKEALFIPREISVQQFQYKGGKVKYYRVIVKKIT